ncbi:MAG TPA: hypothetical protein VFS26_05610, partial [Solirubrobacterales bacterium]|nr:hypothetical protein [Solirubrobacterales bacterium]
MDQDHVRSAADGSIDGAVPGASALLWATAHPRLLGGMRAASARLKARGVRQAVYLDQFVRAVR